MSRKNNDIQGYNIPKEKVQEWADSYNDAPDAHKVICPNCGEVIAIVTGPAKGMQVVCPVCGYSTMMDVDEDGTIRTKTMTKEQYAEFMRKKNRQQ